MNKNVNIAIQIVPQSKDVDAYAIVDSAISVIEQSGVKYRVTPFETVMEGEYSELMKIVEKVQEVCYSAGADSMLCYLKIQSNGTNDVTILDKMEKYD